jgi:hypothetical protein
LISLDLKTLLFEYIIKVLDENCVAKAIDQSTYLSAGGTLD